MTAEQNLPLAGIKVIEFTHMVMGPTVGVILADLGADVIKIEPLQGDNTRRLTGSGAGYFPMYNRNKRSLCIDLKSEEGHRAVEALTKSADILIENFRPGAMAKLGFGYQQLSELNPRLIYCSCKGFLAGPYEHRTALDEVTQMMGGLAYMTGPPGRPLRAGSSVVDVMGGMFGVIGILAALEERHRTGKGQEVKSSLYESTVFLMGQHMAQHAVSGQPLQPMSVRLSAWAVYETFDTADEQKVFVGVVSDTQWRKFCEAFGLDEFLHDPTLAANTDRVKQRDRIIPVIQDLFKTFTKQALMDKLEHTGLPFAPIATPEDLFTDTHLTQSGGLLDITLPTGTATKLPALPLSLHDQRLGLRMDLPAPGEQSAEILREIGYSEEDIARLTEAGILNSATSQ